MSPPTIRDFMNAAIDRDTAAKCAKLAMKIGKDIGSKFPDEQRMGNLRGVASGTGAIICEAICTQMLGFEGVPMEWEPE